MQSGAETSLDELVNCKYCRGINLENLTAENGYLHAPSRSSLVRSAQKCRLCSLLFRKDRSRHSSQLRLKLEAFSDDDPQVCLRVTHLNNNALVGHQLSFFLYTSPGMSRFSVYMFEFLLNAPGDPAANYGITEKRALSQTQSQDSFKTASRWIDECVSDHDCSTHLSLREQENMFPSRLIDVNAFKDSKDMQLIDNDGSCNRYITLSYCWGRSRTFTTTSRSLRLRKARIHFETLPRTFVDAVRIARELKVRFLWIEWVFNVANTHGSNLGTDHLAVRFVSFKMIGLIGNENRLRWERFTRWVT